MTQEETIENNKLIAEFMGWEIYKNVGREVEYFVKGQLETHHKVVDNWLSFLNMKYHSSWDWLMPVVEKIETFNHAVTITQNICTIRACIMGDRTVRAHQTGNYKTPDTKLYNTWLAVVEFVKWYNSNKDNNG